MRIGVAFSNLRNRLSAFVSNERGNVMFTFALATVPMIAFVGAAVDYSRANSARTAMQSAVDATALILSKEAQKLSTAQLNTKATQIFNAQFHRPDVTNLLVTPVFTDSGTGNYKLTLTATGTVLTTFTRIVGQERMEFGATNEVVWGVKKLELALALDVTGSMASNNKMTELKKAAKSLLTTLKGVAKKDGDVKVAIVPFAVDVNVGTNYVNAAWLDWRDWSEEPAVMKGWIEDNRNRWDRTGPGDDCPFTNDTHGFRCTRGPASRSNDSTVSEIPSSGTYDGMICPSRDNGRKSTAATGLLTNRYYSGCYTSERQQTVIAKGDGASCGSTPNCDCDGRNNNRVCTKTIYVHNWRPQPKSAWNGCVRDRNQNYDTQAAPLSYVATTNMQTNIDGVSENYPTAATPAASATSDAFQPHQFYDCSAASLMSLSFNWSALSDRIDSLQPLGNTNVTIGLDWAFNALTSGGPLGNAAVPSGDLDKVIILLTDGDNTQNRWTTSQSDIDARTQLACDNVKKANIKLYTIRVIDGNANLLRGCATRTDMYYNVQNASQLNDVFAQIAKNLANLRIAK